MGIITGTFNSDNLRGTSGLDVILGLSGNDTIYGMDGLDTIDGGDGNDTIYANSDASWSDGALNVLSGGAGDDMVFAGLGDAANGGTGFDVLSLDLSSSTDGISVDFRPMTLLDLSGLVTIDLKGASLAGFEAIGKLIGSAFDDTLVLGNQNHYASTVDAGAGNDSIRLGNGADALNGGTGNDVLVGGAGRDTINGGADNDRLLGGRATDTLTGGTGADTFVLTSERDTSAGRKHADVITDFSHAEGDKIALNRIDAVQGTDANDRFHYIGHDAFSGTAGELRSAVVHGNTVVFGDTNGDGKSDFAIQLHGAVDLVATDFIL